MYLTRGSHVCSVQAQEEVVINMSGLLHNVLLSVSQRGTHCLAGETGTFHIDDIIKKTICETQRYESLSRER